ncbi:MAG: hypothetical protein A3D28_03495, partial [Omnitrophica bacterium RIFCSPHIGHO2_02_FULL_63_14]
GAAEVPEAKRRRLLVLDVVAIVQRLKATVPPGGWAALVAAPLATRQEIQLPDVLAFLLGLGGFAATVPGGAAFVGRLPEGTTTEPGAGVVYFDVGSVSLDQIQSAGAQWAGAPSLAEASILWFEQLGQRDTEVAGGKGANLGEMIRQEVGGVPQGYVVTAKAFQDTLSVNNAHEELEAILQRIDVGNAETAEQEAKRIQKLIRGLTLPQKLQEEILRYHQELADRVGIPAEEIRVAVRSSATAEDREVTEEMKARLGEEVTSGSSAGQQSTYLNVPRTDIVGRVLDDYASLFNPEAVSYRDTQGMVDFLLGLEPGVRGELEHRLLEREETREVGRLLQGKRHVSRVQLRRGIELAVPELLESFDTAYEPYVNLHRLSLAVVVQHMIRSERAFTVFSYDNRSGWTGLSFEKDNFDQPAAGRVFRIDANYGLGESIVQGKTNPDSYLVHVFTDPTDRQHVNILEKTLGTKKLQYIYVEDALEDIGLTEVEAMQIVGLVKATEQQGKVARRGGMPEPPMGVLSKLHLARSDSDALITALLRVAELDYDVLDDFTLPDPIRHIALDRAQFIRLAHFVKTRKVDPDDRSMATVVPAMLRGEFAFTDDRVREIALAAKGATDFYGNVRDMEGAQEGKALGFVQSRAITVETEIARPSTLQLKKAVVNEAAAKAAERAGDLLVSGVPGRNAVVGEIFVLDKESDVPYGLQLKQAQDRAAEIAREGRKLLLRTKMTTPQDVPAMKVSGGVIADEGGDTSHAAIVSRELKIATVVGISEELERIRRRDPTRHAELLAALNTPGNIVTVDANTGKVYRGELPIEVQEVDIPAKSDPTAPASAPHLPELRFTKPGLIVANPAAMREISKIGLYDSYYGVSLARAEFILVDIGVHPRAIEAYDNLKTLEADPEAQLDERGRRDVEMLRKNASLIADIEDKVRGYPSAKEFFIQKMYEGIASMAAANGLHQKVLYRFNDFKQNELNQITGGPEFGLVEEASMIGDRGTGWLLKDENRTALGMELEALRRAYDDGYTNVGAFFAFVRTPDELAEGLRRFEEAQMPLDTVGMMVELPSNVIHAREFADLLAEYGKRNEKHVFFSFGTNDLTQLTRVAGREEPHIRELFSEAHRAIVGSIRHVVQEVARARERHGVDFTCGLCGQAIVKLVDSDPAAARSIAVMLDSTGLDILAFMKAVKLIAEAELDLGRILAKAAAGARILALGTGTQRHGAASRQLLVAQKVPDLAQVSLGDVLVLANAGSLRTDDVQAMLRGEPTAFTTALEPEVGRLEAKAVEQFVDRIQRDTLSAEMRRFAGELKERLPADEAERQEVLASREFHEAYVRLSVFDAIDRAGAVVIPGDHPAREAVVTLARTFAKPVFFVTEGLDRLHTGEVVTVDFAAGRVYEGELPLTRAAADEEDAVRVVERADEPERLPAIVTTARDVYQRLGIHPVAFTRRQAGTLDKRLSRLLDEPNHRYQQLVREADGIEDAEPLFKRTVRQVLREAAEQARRRATALVYRTSDLNSHDFQALALGEELDIHEENPPLGLGGFYRFVKLDEYRTLLRWELEVVAQLQQELGPIAVELADVRDLEHLDTALQVLAGVGLEPGKAGFQLGVRMVNPDNYLFASDYMTRGRLSFVSVDERRLSQTYLAADRDNAFVPVDDAVAAKNLVLPMNMIKQAAHDAGVRWVVPADAPAQPKGITEEAGPPEANISAAIEETFEADEAEDALLRQP